MKKNLYKWIKSHRIQTAAVCIAAAAVAAALVLIPVLSGRDADEKKTASVAEEKEKTEITETDRGAEGSEEKEKGGQADQEENKKDPSNKDAPRGDQNTERAQASASGGSGRDEQTGSGAGADSEEGLPPSDSAEPGHRHEWKAHQVWVPDVVTVVDEAEKTVYGAQLYTRQSGDTWVPNGEIYWFEDGFTEEDLKAVVEDKIRNEGYIGSYVKREKKVPAVTHTEDRGGYQTDYYYCECGAVKE